MSVRSASRKIRCDNDGSRSNIVRNASSLHLSTTELSFASTDADRGIPHKTANSPRTVPGFASVKIKCSSSRSTKTSSVPVNTNNTKSALSPSLSNTSPGTCCLTSPEFNNRFAPFIVIPLKSGKPVIRSAYSFMIGGPLYFWSAPVERIGEGALDLLCDLAPLRENLPHAKTQSRKEPKILRRRRRCALVEQSISARAILNLFLCQLHQLFRHPFSDALVGRSFNARRTIVPFVVISFGAALAFVIFGLLQRKYDALRDIVPIFLLNSAQNQRQPGGPILFRSARVLFRNG